MVPVLFAYGGWQTATFVAGEIREPKKNLPRGLLIGVSGVVFLYLAVNFVCLSVLGTGGLAETTTPASDVMRLALGEPGRASDCGGHRDLNTRFFESGYVDCASRIFRYGGGWSFLQSVGRLHPNTRVPVVAIALQGVLAIVIALSGRYEQILNYVVSVDFIFFGLTAICIFVFRKRKKVLDGSKKSDFTTVPGHPITTGLFVIICWLVVINTIYRYPENTIIGLAILLAGIPAYFFWRPRKI